ncbi:hypothetical protein AMTR_s00019p00139900 [Amborella trichopoda]|uniref:Uncharacterized protein n=1 Tax=Amborella trichopoda TaxID=13333 RepID=W1PHR5_AMBTC|nr:hypothetical protein AMTR_s00019p00139900 [Amborella trichopoda]
MRYGPAIAKYGAARQLQSAVRPDSCKGRCGPAAAKGGRCGPAAAKGGAVRPLQRAVRSGSCKRRCSPAAAASLCRTAPAKSSPAVARTSPAKGGAVW